MEKEKPTLIVIAGPNGSGKTSITSKILKHDWLRDCLYINPDEIAQHQFGDWNSKENVLKAAQVATDLRYQCLNDGKSLIFETVFSSQEKIDFIFKAKEIGYFIRFFFICTSHPTINASRIARRVMEGGHEVPISKIISRYYKSLANSYCIVDVVDRFYIYDNSTDFQEANLVFRASHGILTKKYQESIPKWTMQLFDLINK